MTITNRLAEVTEICQQHPESFPPGDQNDPARLKLLLEFIIPALNLLDGGEWGYMTKTDQVIDQGPPKVYKVPCDVLMWRSTNQSVDCLTGTGAMWEVHAQPAPPAWQWTAVGGTPIPNPPVPPIPPTPVPEPLLPTYKEWILDEYPQIIEAWQFGQQRTDRPGDMWATMTTFRRYGPEKWTLAQLIAHERSFRKAS